MFNSGDLKGLYKNRISDLLIRHSGRIAVLLGTIFSFVYYLVEIEVIEPKNYIFNEVSLGSMVLFITLTICFYFGIRRLEGEFNENYIFKLLPLIATIIGLWAGYLKLFL